MISEVTHGHLLMYFERLFIGIFFLIVAENDGIFLIVNLNAWAAWAHCREKE